MYMSKRKQENKMNQQRYNCTGKFNDAIIGMIQMELI